MIKSLLGIILVLAILALVLTSLRWYQKTCSPHPEIPRKILHVVMGVVSLTFPWLFAQEWAVVLLAVMSGTGLTLLKRLKGARERIGNVFCAVGRESFGEICFPLSVAILFVAPRQNILLYIIPIVILTVSDALSALIGIFWGKTYYSTKDGRKTREGSLAFFASAAASTWLLLTLSASIGQREALCIAIILGCLVMIFEAIAWRGLDNLFIPLSAYVLLKMYLNSSLEALVFRVVAAIALVVAGLLWRRHTTLDDSAVLGAALSCYISWMAGGLPWLIPPLILFACYRCMLPEQYRKMPRIHSIYAVISVASLGFFWLFLSRATGHAEYIYPYTLAYAAHLSIITVAHLDNDCNPSARLPAIFLSSIKSWLLFFIPYLFLSGLSFEILSQAALALPAVAGTAFAFSLLYDRAGESLSTIRRWVSQAALVASSSALSFLALNISVLSH